jgi:hypothetical protein
LTWKTSKNISQAHYCTSFQQYEELQQIIVDTQLTQNNDKWIYPWSGKFSSMKFDRLIIGQATAYDLLKKNCGSMLKHKVFFWLVLYDITTQETYSKEKCTFQATIVYSVKEYKKHNNFFGTAIFHSSAGILLYQEKNRGISFYDEVHLTGKQIHQKIHIKVTILGCWNIWNERNRKIFKNERASIQNWKRQLQEDLALFIHRAKQEKASILKDWIQNNF